MQSFWQRLKDSFFEINSRSIYLHSVVVGSLVGLLAIVFHTLIRFFYELLFVDLVSYPLGGALGEVPSTLSLGSQSLIVIIPTLGGLLVGLCTYYWCFEAKGSGLEQLLEGFHKQQGDVRKRTAFAKFVTSFFTLSTGGSAGKEGPMALIGAGVGSLFAKFMKMGDRARRTMLLAGSAGGLGAIFKAPLGGAITAVEVLYKEDFEADALLPCIISSVTAYTFFSSVIGFGHSLSFNDVVIHSPIELIFFVFLGVLCSGAGVFFIQLHRALTQFFLKVKLHPIFKPALGGLLIGIIGLFMPKAIGEGLGFIQSLLNADFETHAWATVVLFLGLALLKMLATNLTISSGGSGGILIPSFFIGAVLGGAFGIGVHHYFPSQAPSVTPYIIVGMAGFLASVTNASLGALVMVTELTGGYELLPPLMVVATISLIISRKWSIYQNQVKNKFYSKAHQWDLNAVNENHYS